MIGPDTVNTVPPATLDAFRDHGHARQSLTEDIEGARQVMATLASVWISIDEITAKLTEDGVRLFAEAFDKLLEAVEKSGKSETSPQVNRQSYKLPEELAAAVKTNLDDWRAAGKVRRLWQRDASLRTRADESNGLGRLGTTEDEITHSSDLQRVAADVKHLVRHHRSWFEARASRNSRPLPSGFSRASQHWRTLLRAFEFRHGACRANGVGYHQVPRSHRRNGRGLRFLRSGGRKSRRGAGNNSWDGGQERPGQSHNRHLTRDLRSWRVAGTVAG